MPYTSKVISYNGVHRILAFNNAFKMMSYKHAVFYSAEKAGGYCLDAWKLL